MAKKLETAEPKPSHEEIAQRAHELFEKSGCIPGRDVENWLEAEAQLMAARRASATAEAKPNVKMPAKPAPRQPLAIRMPLGK